MSWLTDPLAPSGKMSHLRRGEVLLLLAGLACYLYTRFAGLTAFPIYFFCDEAIHGVLARDLVANGFRSSDGVWLPPYFRNAEKWNLSLSVYVHAISILLFGFDHSVWQTRATSVIAGLLAPLGVAALLRFGYNNRHWWLGIFVLSAMPAWFLHSRTAFETALMVACYAGFLATYAFYRYYDDRWIVAVILFGAATFYSYANGQGVMLVSGVMLLAIDARYHFSRPPQRLWTALAVLAIVLTPLLRFRWLHPDATVEHLRALNSYWLQPLPLSEKIRRFLEIYAQGLDPRYWFWPNTIDLDRHRFPDSGHLPLFLLPFVLIGLGVCLWHWRESIYRLPIVALLAAPFSSALVGIAITRALAMVIPATVLTVIGISVLIERLPLSWQRLLSILSGGVLVMSSLTMTQTALLAGPLWFRDYGLNGMQYGAQTLFGEVIPTLLERDPHIIARVSPTWANNPNSFADFFLNPAQRRRIEFVNIDAYQYSRRDLDPQRDVFIMTAAEYDRALQSAKFIIAPPEQIIWYPDGQPGFYITRMEYVANIDELMAAERAARMALVEEFVTLDRQELVVAHSQFDIGSVIDLFDGNLATLARGFEANPLVIELRFANPQSVNTIELTVGTMDFDLTVTVTTPEGEERVFNQQYRGLSRDPTVTFDLPAPLNAAKLRLDILQIGVGEPAHVHVREVTWR
ncbi:glycosyltransferase family 39 protein [uncultured Chloroflexus sp.]|nr:glycosyltransferase family 39 protein [uncultured Chloroflexus sp.]